VSMEQRLAEGLVFLVVDGTIGFGRTMATRLCVHGARVAVVGVALPGRPDDAAASAALTCKELTGSGRMALPYRLDLVGRNAIGQLMDEVREDLGPVTATLAVIPPDTAPAGLPMAFRTLSAGIAEGIPDGCRHLEVDSGPGGRDGRDPSAQDSWALRVSKLLFTGTDPYPG
jgi:NAD(P)-dependent dehydrogenase (short-subunit alcohol dehydrogenase family)